jgi:P2-related tail formation protein
LHAPSEEILDNLAAFFNPYQTPDDFVPYLASWVDLARLLFPAPVRQEGLPGSATLAHYPAGLGRLRELIAAAAELSQWRGTRQGLVRFLEIATGVAGFTIQEQVLDAQGEVRPFHLQVHAPAAAHPVAALVERIVELEKPAYMTAEVLFDHPASPTP